MLKPRHTAPQGKKRKVPLPSVERLARHQRDIKRARPTRGEVEASARVIVALT